MNTQKNTLTYYSQIAFFERYLLTVEEAAYFHIGNKKFYEIFSNNRGTKWILYSGK